MGSVALVILLAALGATALGVLVVIRARTAHLAELVNRVDAFRQKLDDFFEQTLKPELEERRQFGARLSGHLERFAQAVTEIEKDVTVFQELRVGLGDLANLLKPQQFRGPLGEILVRELIRDKLPAEYVREQHAFRNGARVDFAIALRDKLIPVDAKFPIENYKRVREAASEADQRRFRMEFRRDVKRHIDEVAQYIRPEEQTYNFAVMVIPSEGVYYEAIIREEDFTDDNSLYRYATARNVVAASPYTFWALLTVIEQGLRGFEISRQAERILQVMQGMTQDLRKFSQGEFRLIGEHLKNASRNFDLAGDTLKILLTRLELRETAALPGADGQLEERPESAADAPVKEVAA
ncbi:MAG: DNA recombination protein RmuC [Candidatus Omnitrophica bacterium]|nr:DNA recombination protein RmuC [Candidatus Omnitrophota bacterium]